VLNFLLGKGARAKAITAIAEEEVSSKLASVLYLPLAAGSISYRPYLDNVRSATLLEWFFDTFMLANCTMNLSVLFHAEDETPQLKEILLRYNVTTIPTSHKLPTYAFQQAAKQAGKSHTAIFTIEMGLSPQDLLTKAFLHHLKHENKFTFVKGLPLECTPEIYDSDFLTMICGLRIPNIPQKPRAFIERSLIASTDKALLPRNRMSRSLAITLNGLINVSLASTPFDASDVYIGDPCDLPESVRINSQFHVEVIRDVVHSRASGDPVQSPLQTLYLWKRASLQKQRAIIADLAKAENFSTGGPVGKKSNRVLYVSNRSAYSGAEESLCQLIGQIDPEQYESFALVGASGFFTERLQKLGTKVITRERDFSEPTVENFFFTLSVLKKVQPDVIHINGVSGIPIILTAKLLGIPIIYHLRIVPLEIQEESLKNSDVIISISEFIRREASKKDIEKDRIRVIYNGIDLQHFSGKAFDKATMRREFGIPRDARVVLHIARFAPNKRHDLLIAASEIARKTVPGFHLVLVGGIDDVLYHRSIVDQISKSELKECVTFVGFQRDIRKIEAAADVLVLCSDREPLGRCLMEAMAMEIPVITTDSGGSHELLKPGTTGLVTRGGNAIELATAMTSILTDKDLAKRLTRAAREYAEAELSIGLHAKRIINVYEEVITRAMTAGLEAAWDVIAPARAS
jgi:glycosyltransferase involved in cell wall biosynthesis